MIHPARTIPFAQLWHGLQRAKAEGLVQEVVSVDGLRLYTYTRNCIYEKRWDEISMLARGLILHPESQRVIATPYPKFFNAGERPEPIPSLPFETFEKLDGSLIILFHFDGQWQTATKGSFVSDQAKWAAGWIQQHDLSWLDKDTTYLAEAIYPENRILVHYPFSDLVLHGAYRGDGAEVDYAALQAIGDSLGWRVVARRQFKSLTELLALTKILPASEEGFVLRFENGLRLKVKGDEYCRIQRAVSRLTPLAVWELMMAGDDLEAFRKQLPEEFWDDFDAIVGLVQSQVDALLASVKAVAETVAHLSDKEVGLRLATLPETEGRFIFNYRKSEGKLLSSRTREQVFRTIRPVGNRLEGYVPSSAMSRITEDEG
jgi:RNA ligase